MVYGDGNEIIIKKTIIMGIKEKYWSNTPVFWKKIGDAMLASSTTITTFAIYNDYKWVAITALIAGTLGKFISNLFTENGPNNA